MPKVSEKIVYATFQVKALISPQTLDQYQEQIYAADEQKWPLCF